MESAVIVALIAAFASFLASIASIVVTLYTRAKDRKHELAKRHYEIVEEQRFEAYRDFMNCYAESMSFMEGTTERRDLIAKTMNLSHRCLAKSYVLASYLPESDRAKIMSAGATMAKAISSCSRGNYELGMTYIQAIDVIRVMSEHLLKPENANQKSDKADKRKHRRQSG